MADYWKISVNKYKDSTGNWKVLNMVDSGSDPYLNITGKVDPMVKYKEPTAQSSVVQNQSMLDNDGKEFGSFKVSAELTGLINPFTNPVTNTQVKETKIEVSYEGDPWEYMVDKKTYSESLTLGACEKIEKRYKDLFGVEIKLKRSFVSNPDESKSTSGTNGTSGSSGSSGNQGKVVVEEQKPTGTTGTSGQTGPQIYGEFTFNVEDAFLFKGDQDFDLLEILYKGLTKEEEADVPEEEEEIDEEYDETQYMGDELYDIQLQVLEEFSIAAFKEDPELEALSNSESDTTSTSTSAKATAGDSSDFWALVAVCTCEDAEDQSRTDVAQSIYNRVASGLFGGKTIKRVVTASWQFEPAFDKSHRSRTHATWNAISDKDTAIAALKYSKNWSDKVASAALKATYDAISNPKYQKIARDYVQQRTDFLGVGLGTSWFKGTGKWSAGKSSTTPIRRNNKDNIFGNVCGGGSYAYGKKNIIADVPTELLNKFKF
jgi:hypothetical protein